MLTLEPNDMSRYFLTLLIFAISTQLSFAQEKFVTDNDEIAFEGFDLTTYFNGQPVKGKAEHSLEHNKLKLRFATAQNKDRFVQNPEEFLPAYGGWCATAMIYGDAVRPDFTRFKTQSGKILFFEVKAFFNGETQWDKDPAYYEVLAEAQYMKYVREVEAN